MGHLESERDGPVAVCTITPPDRFMNQETVAALDALTAELAADDDVRAVVFTGGHAGYFIPHYDVRELEAIARRLAERGAAFDPARPVPERQLDHVFRRMGEMAKPVVAAINGTAMGGGFEFAMACDIRIAQAGAYRLGLPEINVGILPGAGGTQRLARLVGRARALEMVLRGRTVAPDEALSLGMVHEVAEGPPLGRALAIAHEIAAKSPLAVAHIKRLIRHETARPMEDALAVERTLFLDLMVSERAIELMGAMNRGEIEISDPAELDQPT